jgi:hypothetical protein
MLKYKTKSAKAKNLEVSLSNSTKFQVYKSLGFVRV